jgi:hypothetical protein
MVDNGDPAGTSVGGIRMQAREPALEPVLMERRQADVMADHAEAVNIGVAQLGPVAKLDAELERALRACDEVGFVQPEQVVEQLDVRDGRLADTDDADLFGLDQPHGDLLVQYADQRGGSHPAGRSATYYHDVGYAVGHRCSRMPAKERARGETHGRKGEAHPAKPSGCALGAFRT